ncbi:MAG: glycoside hydrolase 43 family protein [Gammaproteobacteria bacterium]|nr:glycoside hydrolase 43 family protein [Gammaproteobacteria bacterium]
MRNIFIGTAILVLSACTTDPGVAPWIADQGNGTYKNPVLFADYSDPDVIRVGDDYYMISSSFNSAPGLPVLHSKDLVNWRLINHIVKQQTPLDVYAKLQHGNGVWAPCIRYHNNKYWVFFPDPDYGIYMTQATDPAADWSRPILMLAGKGLIDPTPLWDADGNAYLLHAWAKSRAGFNNVLTLHKMSADGTKTLDEGSVIIDGNKLPGYRTLEGPKFYQANGYYYVFAPAGGVEQGWQSVFRSKNIYGPYEDRIVLDQGDTEINGPHQGAWVITQTGESWFFHFQSLGPYGRIVHLQPMQWHDDWPVIGQDSNADGKGEPVLSFRKPDVGAKYPITVPQTSDDFAEKSLGLQWQWNANWEPDWYSLTERNGYLRLYTQPVSVLKNLWSVPFLLFQKLPAPSFDVIAGFDASNLKASDYAGLLLYGYDYAWIGIRKQSNDRLQLVLEICIDARNDCEKKVTPIKELTDAHVNLRMTMQTGGAAQFSYSQDGNTFIELPEVFTAKPGRWVGAKVGVFAATNTEQSSGFIDIDRFLVR